ncbi:MAG: A/G-specific adenine glycosylase [Cytophagales bacterium]|nr:A/G-specific adenine glycosylase [Cytophagales bacterium]
MRNFSSRLQTWYKDHRRPLPFRDTQDPYRTWIAEIILQQTRIAQGLPHYERFIKTFPKIQDLALTSEKEVLYLWQGLGYYSRARNLHKGARYIFYELGGKFPKTAQAWRRVCGVGPYTAAALASFLHREKVPTLDGNVFRVATRLFGIAEPIARSSTRRRIEGLLLDLMPDDDPGEFNQALMEFGSLHCSPRPKCVSCPFQTDCYAYLHQNTGSFPNKGIKKALKDRFFHYILIQQGDKILFRKRGQKDIWQGLYEPLLVEREKLCGWDELKSDLNPCLRKNKPSLISGSVRHVLTHQRLHIIFFHLSLDKTEDLNKMASDLEMSAFLPALIPLPIVLGRYLIREETGTYGRPKSSATAG